MAEMIGTPRQDSGIPLGGLGAGTIELRSDGEFHEWQISNTEKWSRVCGNRKDVDNGENLAGGLSFYIRTEGGRDPVRLRRLGFGFGSGQDREEYNYRMFSWLKTVEAIKFTGKFPMAELEYIDGDLPVQVKLQAASPFVPHQHQTAGTPGFYLSFQIQNRSDEEIRVSLAGKLKNPVCMSEPNGKRKNELVIEKNSAALFMKSEENSEKADNGSVCLSAQGGDLSWISGEYAAYMNEYVAGGDFGVSEESFLFALRRDGRLPDVEISGEFDEPISYDDGDISTLSDEELDRLIEKFHSTAYGQSLFERVRYVKPDLLKTREGRVSWLIFLRDTRRRLMGSLKEWHGPWGDGALCSSFRLLPNQVQTVTFILSWYFPNHFSETGSYLGHMYQNYFSNALEANRSLMARQGDILSEVKNFTDNLYNTSLAPFYADAWSIHLATLLKSSWWLKSGDFAIWEGLGSCGFHTMDITYHGSFGLLSLFPELQKRQMRMGAKFQRDDGRVHHFFTPDLSSVDQGFDRVDMNPQFVLLVCRDYLSTGDKNYLHDLWPNVLSAMNSIAALDSDQDGLPDTNTKRNTYDSWNFSGVSAYVSSLWLGALKAAAFIAEQLNECGQADIWKCMFEKGIQSFNEKLWNGQYYSLWVNGEHADSCCMTNQLDGEWYARIIGLGGFLPEDRVDKALASIFAHNFTEEGGLINASYPAGASKLSAPTLNTYRNCQAEANWTGIEYSLASLYSLAGQEEKAADIVSNIDRRYKRVGQIWNHSECGDHYYRALSSWALLPALTGWNYNAASGILTLTKNFGAKFNAPWVTYDGFGHLESNEGKYTIRCLSGNLLLNQVIFSSGSFGQAELLLNGKKVDSAVQVLAEKKAVTCHPIRMEKNDKLELCLS